MPEEIKPLCLSFWTPPLVRPQSILIGKMVPEWVKQGLKPAIMAYDHGRDWRINAPVYRIGKFKPSSSLAKIPFISTIYLYNYYKSIAREAEAIIKEHDLNVIFSFSNPQESNIVGAMLKKRTGVKFVSHFSDPWFDNIYKSFSWLGAKKVLLQEKYIIKNSDRIIFITEEARDLVMGKYPSKWKEKARIIPHCYDLGDYPADIKKTGGEFTISYIGAFYKQRNPEILFKALRNLLPRKSDERNIKLVLVGCANDYAGYSEEAIKNLLEEYRLGDIAEIVPVVDYKKSLEYMKFSDCLVVIDADMPKSPYLTSKVVDYIGSNNFIIGITPDDSPTAKLLKEIGCQSFNYQEINELSDYLKKIISTSQGFKINQDIKDRYNVKNTTKKLIEVFKELI